MQAERTISSIKSTAANLTTDSLGINNFQDFYKMLYTSECTEMGKEQNTFLSQLKFQTVGELLEAIGDIKGGKAAGPDGLPIECYKTFRKQLNPYV